MSPASASLAFVEDDAKYGCFLPGSNRRPCACEAHVITATLRKPHRHDWCSVNAISQSGPKSKKKAKKPSSHLGVEPRTFGLEVQRAIHCANGTLDTHWLVKMVHFHVTRCTCFGSTYTKIGTIQRRLAWPLRKDDTQNREAFHIFWPGRLH